MYGLGVYMTFSPLRQQRGVEAETRPGARCLSPKGDKERTEIASCPPLGARERPEAARLHGYGSRLRVVPGYTRVSQQIVGTPLLGPRLRDVRVRSASSIIVVSGAAAGGSYHVMQKELGPPGCWLEGS